MSRSRKQNANLSVIQKKHFAKARGALLNGRQPPPRLDLAFFEEAEHDTAARITSPTRRLRPEGKSTQHTLDEYEHVRPVIDHLSSLRPRSCRGTSRQPRVTGEQHSKCSPQHHGGASSRRRRRSSPDSASQRQHESASSSIAQNPIRKAPLDELEAKRQQLLTSSDWVGLQQLKPVKMKFADVEDRDLIGKRRHLEQSHHCPSRQAPQHRRRSVNPYEKLRMLQANSNIGSSPGKISVHMGSSDRGTVGKRTEYSVGERESSSPGIMLEDILREEVSNTALGQGFAVPDQEHLRQSSSSIAILPLDDGKTKSPSTQHAGAIEKLNPFSYQGTNAVDNATILREAYAISSRAESEEGDEAQFEGEELDWQSSTVPAPTVNGHPPAAPKTAGTRDYSAFELRRSLDKTMPLPVPNKPCHAASAHMMVKGSEYLPPATGSTLSDVNDNDDSEHKITHPYDAFTGLKGYREQCSVPAEQPKRLVEPSKYFRSPPTVFQSTSTVAEPEPQNPKSASNHPPSSPKARDIKEQHTTAPSPSPAPEALWRSFVFGSPSPQRDPINAFNPAPKPIQSSSPLLPIGTTTLAQSSPTQQNPPSPLIAEASSPSIHSQSKQQSKETTPALAEYDTSPIRTQHSTTAQPSLSPDELAAVSSSPVRQLPPVIFTRPRPFVGERSDASTGPFLRIGGAAGRRRRGADGRFLKARQEDMGEGTGVVGDEIVD